MSVTEQDRERARDLLFPELAHEMPHNIARLQFSDESTGQIARIAQALADERERARAAAYAQGRVEELELMADGLESRPPLVKAYSNSRRSIARRLRYRADLIRRAAEETDQ